MHVDLPDAHDGSIVLLMCDSFLTVLAGTSADYESLSVAENPLSLLPSLATLVPETQLCSAAQYNTPANHNNTPASPLYRPRAFPASKLSRYVVGRAFKFLVLELRSFADVHEHLVGLSWIEVYGEPAAEFDNESALIEQATASAKSTMQADEWQRDPDGDAMMATPRGLQAFKPTGEAERLLRIDAARAPPKPTPAQQQQQQARPILNRNESFLAGLREGATTAAPAAAAAPKPPSCPQHHGATLIQRQDRRTLPARTYYVCLGKDATGKSCDTKIYVD